MDTKVLLTTSGEQERLVKVRRALHRIPELDDNLPQTSAYIKNALASLSCRVIEPIRSAVVAYFDLGRPTTVAIRSDMDALPVLEATDLPFASEHEGCMHACGHDGHMAMALAAAEWVDRVIKGEVEGVSANNFLRNILFVFQPAEETTGGAQRIVESGIFNKTATECIFGFHLWPDLPKGQIASRPGALLARSSEVTVDFHGRSAHIARYEEGADALSAAGRFIVAAKWLSRRMEQEESCLMRFGYLSAGTVRNAIAAEAHLEGSCRVFSEEMFARFKDETRSIAQMAADEEGCSFDLTFSEGYPPVINNKELYEQVARALPQMAFVPDPLLIAEDFAFYQQALPGVFMLLGTGTGIALHANTFTFDETILAKGLAAYKQLLVMA